MTESFADPGPKPALDWLPIDRLTIDPRYQRGISQRGERAVRKIARTFAWPKFGALAVAGPDDAGLYHIIDGQHRWEAARLRGDLPLVPCCIIAAGSLAEEATAFAGINDERLGLKRLHLFWAAHAAGEARAVRMKAVCDRAGVTVARVDGQRLGPLSINCIAALMRCVALSETATEAALKVLAEAQPEVDAAFSAAAVTALCFLHVRHGDRIDTARLRQALADVDLDSVIDEAKAIRRSLGLPLHGATELLLTRRYNKGLGINRLPEQMGAMAA